MPRHRRVLLLPPPPLHRLRPRHLPLLQHPLPLLRLPNLRLLPSTLPHLAEMDTLESYT